MHDQFDPQSQEQKQKERWLKQNQDTLTVEQLIEQLQKMPPKAKVFSREDDYEYDSPHFFSYEKRVTGVKEMTLKNGFQIVMLDADFEEAP